MPQIRSPTTPPYYDYRDEFGRRRSTPAFSYEPGGGASKSYPNILSPPPSPTVSRSRNTSAAFSQRLRSNSGLSLHVNEDALRQYTDYNADGTSRGPLFKPFTWQPPQEGDSSDGGRRGLILDEAHEWKLPIPDVFGLEIFQMVLKDPSAAGGLLKFSRESGYGIDMAYLAKTQEYCAVINQLESLLYTISTNYTSVTTASPIQLPSHVSRTLNNDLRYVTGTILPGLDSLFLDSRNCVEQRVLKDLYPSFVKHKLALATTASLASNLRMPEAEYPGLASAFCVTDGQDRDRIKYASDDFAALLGRSRDEVIDGNVATLQGATNPKAALRMQQCMTKERECLELVVSHRKDGEAFWNLVYICPIPNPAGVRRYCLHAYLNVSDRIRSSADVLKLLANDTFKTDGASGRLSTGSAPSARTGRSRSTTPVDLSDDGQTSSQGKGGSRSRSRSSRRLFNPFRKPANVTPQTSHPDKSDNALVGPGGFPEPPLPPLSESSIPSSPQPDRDSACSRIMLLKHHPGVKPKMLIAYASPSALDIVSPTVTLESILDRDVFKVLSEEARSPSVTKSFKSLIRKGVLKAGERVTAEMLLGETRGRKGSVISLPRTSGWSSDGARKETRGPIQINCFWTPLRGGGAVDWVVLVMVPMA